MVSDPEYPRLAELLADEEPLVVGDQVRKVTGDYHLDGEVRATFVTRAGKVRYVVEHPVANSPGGILHIYSRMNLQKRGI